MFAISISNLYTKRLSQKTSQESVRYASVALCAVGTSVTLHYLRPLRVSVCPLYKTFSYHSIFRKSLLLPCYHVFHYPVTMSLITLYHVLNILLPCLLLPCTMSLITLYHIFHYSVTMSLITLSHVFHYPVSIKECKNTKKELTS